jgi:hypothetical protein
MTNLLIVGDFSPDFGPELAPPSEGPRWCADCGGSKTFLVTGHYEGGRIGVCQGCEQVKFLPWERTNSEAA